MAIIDLEIGTYGCAWMEWMVENHKDKVRKMQTEGTYHAVAKSVNDEAMTYWELLERQYLKANPYPNTFEENVKYHATKNFYVEGAVMREKVLIPRTAA